MKWFASTTAKSAIFASLMCLVFASGCSTLDKSDKEMKPPPTPGLKQAAVVIAITEDGKVRIFNRYGRQFTQCKLCSEESCRVDPKDKEAIARLQAAGFCTSLVNATTIKPFLNIAIQKTQVNPYCWTVFMAGGEAESCICEAGEVDPRCIGTMPLPQ
ncbi:MAG: hypothetical protein ABJB49_07375 [Nitrospirota bacterium]